MKLKVSVMSGVVFLFFINIGLATDLFSTSTKSFDIISEYNNDIRYVPQNRWQRAADPQIIEWSSDGLEAAKDFTKTLSTDSLVIVDNGVIVATLGEITTRYKCHSVRKNLLSALYGIHVGEGIIDISKTLSEIPIDDIGSLSEQEKQATIANLLEARSGIYHSAAYETSTMRERRPARGSHPPGTHWHYNNWDFNALLTIFERSTGRDFFEDFKRRIAEPIGMEQFRLKDTRYYWEKSKSSHPAYLFRMSALDLARFGLLFLRNGRWGNTQLIRESWIKASTSPHTLFNKESRTRGYGYLWWSADEGYYAAGKGGQRIMVIPDMNIVVVHLVDTEKKGRKVTSKEFWNLLKMILDAKYRDSSSNT